MSRSLFGALGVLAFAAGAAAAQTPPAAPAFSRAGGTVTAVSASQLQLKAADGKTVDLALAPDWFVVVATPVDFDAIKPGSFIASANVEQPNGEGRAIELRMFEPGSKLGEGNRPMQVPGQMMTNATVSKVSKGANGRELDVAYPGGVRHIVVPPDIQVIASVPGDRSLVKPGVAVTTFATKAADGSLIATRVSIDLPKPPTP